MHGLIMCLLVWLRATDEFLAVDVNENHTFQLGAIGTFDTIQDGSSIGFAAVSYTHLTLPTIYAV